MLLNSAVNGEPDIDARWSVLLDDPLFAVIAKSGNMPCHPGGRYRENTLESLLRKAGFAISHSSKLDIIVEYFIKKHWYDIYDINKTLFDFDQPLLGTKVA